MYCTGGVRCERASSYLLSKNVAPVSEAQPQPKFLCGGDVCTGVRISCNCGCGLEKSGGPVCRRTGYFTRRCKLKCPLSDLGEAGRELQTSKEATATLD